MYLERLSLVNFKNFESQNFEFKSKINCFVGNNGVGKTNVIDAIYFLSFARSYFNPVASHSIRYRQDFFIIDGQYKNNDKTDRIVCSLKKGQKKIIKRNGKIYDKIMNHIGNFPVVIISPLDRDLIHGGSDLRRKFIDVVISQSNPLYLSSLIHYNKLLSQRNALLKYFAVNRVFDKLSLEVYNDQMEVLGQRVFEERRRFVEIFTPLFAKRYREISRGIEKIDIEFKSQLFKASLKSLFKEHIERDKALQYTTQGIHKDDLILSLKDYPIRRFGSQGEQKTFLIALKLAQFDMLKSKTSKSPILLLDDIFDKLDHNRVQHIINLVHQSDFGQLFITDTNKDRTENIINQTKVSYSIFEL